MTANDTNRLKDRLTNQLERAFREQRDEANRDDKGTLKGRVDDPKNTASDDLGQRHRRDHRLTPRKAEEKLNEHLESADAIEPRGGHPSDQRDDTEDSEDVPEYIATFADSEGW